MMTRAGFVGTATPRTSVLLPRGRLALYLSAVIVALFCLRLLGEPWGTHFPPAFPDAFNPGRTDTYYAVAGLTPFRPVFYWAPRPIVYPAFIWLLGRNSHVIVIAQTLAYCGAVGVLCGTAVRSLQTRVIAALAITVIVVIAVQARFALWNTQILSESVGLSLGLIAVAAWWRVGAGPTPRRVTWAWVWTIVWVLERDSHTVPVLVVLLPLTAAAAFLGRRLEQDVRRRLLVGAVIALVACGYVYAAQRASGRNQYSIDSNIGIRVLPDASLRAWFVAGGMPLDQALAGRQGKSAFDDNRLFTTDPALARFRRWADGPGSRRMLESLVLRAPDWYRMLDRQGSSILADDSVAYDTYGAHNRLPTSAPLQLGGPRTPGGLVAWLLLAGSGIIVVVAYSRGYTLAMFAAGGLLFALVEVYTSFVGDPLEVGRHLVGPLSRVAVLLVVSVAIGLDALFQARRSPGPGSELPSDEGDQLRLGLAEDA